MTPLQIASGLFNVMIPGGIAIYHEFQALFKKMPAGTTPEQFAQIGAIAAANSDTKIDTLDETIEADQASHNQPPAA